MVRPRRRQIGELARGLGTPRADRDRGAEIGEGDSDCARGAAGAEDRCGS